MTRWFYHFARIVFGGWWLYSGAMPFIDPSWQPMGNEQPAIDFTRAMIASGLMVWVKVAEIVFGLLILANRLMPLTAIAIIPINCVILYWNFVLDHGTIETVFGILTAVFNALLAWPYRRYYWPLLEWKARADYSLDPGLGR
jgi:uncharacterized membrane protein YphA (DoxX/SURF4 family)